MNQDLKDLTFEELERIVVGLGQKKYLAGYLFKFIHAQNGHDLAALTTLSKAFRAQLAEQGYVISRVLRSSIASMTPTARPSTS